MKASLLLAATAGLILLLGTAPVSRAADPLEAETLTVSGTLYQHTADPKKPLAKLPLNVALLLKLFGYPNVKPSTAKFFYDPVSLHDVLASADKMTVYGTFFAYGSAGTLNISGLAGAGVEQGNATMLNGQLAGAYFSTYLDKPATSKATVTFIAHGSISGVDTLIKGSFTYNEPIP